MPGIALPVATQVAIAGALVATHAVARPVESTIAIAVEPTVAIAIEPAAAVAALAPGVAGRVLGTLAGGWIVAQLVATPARVHATLLQRPFGTLATGIAGRIAAAKIRAILSTR